MRDLISLSEAARRGIERVRKPIWSIPMDHLRIHPISTSEGTFVGAFAFLFSPSNKWLNGEDGIRVPLFGMCEDLEWAPYDGPLPGSPEYQAEEERFMEYKKQEPAP